MKKEIYFIINPQGHGWIGNNMKLVATDHPSSSFRENKEK